MILKKERTFGEDSQMDAVQASFSVGRWVVDPALHQLSLNGRAVKVEPKAMAVLCYLAERPKQVVSREALLAAVWPDVIVGDDALTQVVAKLRRALGDTVDEPTYIETITKGGYRFIAPVVRTGSGAVTAGLADALGRRSRRWPARFAGGLAVLVVAAALSPWFRDKLSSMDRDRTGPVTAPVAIPTVAIQTFDVLGEDPQALLLARAVTDDLANDLSKLTGLRVVRSDSNGSQGLGGASATIRYRVAGSVARSDERIRLQVQLFDAQTGGQLWSDRFEAAVNELFDVQDELDRRILGVLPVKVSEAERQRMAERYTRNLDAYETYQRGQLSLQTRRRDDNELARNLFLNAIALDAAFARAYVGLAMTYTAEFRNQWAVDGSLALQRALELAGTAFRINPDIPETCWVLAFVHSHRHEHQEALSYLNRALSLNPSFADGYALKGAVLTSTGRAAEGVLLLHDAMRLAPQSGYTYFMLLGRAYFALGQLEQARIYLQHALTRNPEFVDAHAYLAATLLAQGDQAAARWEADEIRALNPRFTAAAWLKSNPTADPALKAKLTSLLELLDL